MTMSKNTGDGELREKLAAIEHERWADWQTWCHKILREHLGAANKELEAVLRRWERQIATPYSELSNQEKASDMEQVDRYWPLIKKYTAQEANKARISELKQLEPPGQFEEYAKLMGSEQCNICGFNALEFRRHIQERIKALTADKEPKK